MQSRISPIRYMILFLFILASCASGKEQVKSKAGQQTSFNMPQQIIKYTRGSCFGKCPVFELSIFDDGKAILEGKMHMNHIGLFEYTLKPGELDELQNLLEGTDFASMEDTYYGEIADVPPVGLTVRTGSMEKTIGGNWQFPEELTAVFSYLDTYVHSEKWLPMEGKDPFYRHHQSIIPDRIIVDLEPTADPEKWILKYKKYQAKIIKRIAPRLNLYLITFNPEAIHPLTFIEKLETDTSVNKSEFDKKLKKRR